MINIFFLSFFATEKMMMTEEGTETANILIKDAFENKLSVKLNVLYSRFTKPTLKVFHLRKRCECFNPNCFRYALRLPNGSELTFAKGSDGELWFLTVTPMNLPVAEFETARAIAELCCDF